MHVPRTGGTSAYNSFMIALANHGRRIYPVVNGKGPPHDWNSPGCDHYPWYGGTHCTLMEMHICLSSKLFPSHDIRFLTTFRHPVERVISEYRWWLQDKSNIWTAAMKQKSSSLKEWVLEENNVAHNRLAFFLLHDGKYVHDECVMTNAVHVISWVKEHYGSFEGMNNSTSAAKQALSRIDVASGLFSFIALLDRPKASNQAFAREFGYEGQQGKVRNNKSTQKTTAVSDEIRELIKSRNRLDMQIYREICLRIDPGNPAGCDKATGVIETPPPEAEGGKRGRKQKK